MSRIENFYTGGEEYFIIFEKGNHVIKRVDGDQNTIIFTGHYDKCLAKKQEIIEANADYDLNL